MDQNQAHRDSRKGRLKCHKTSSYMGVPLLKVAPIAKAPVDASCRAVQNNQSKPTDQPLPLREGQAVAIDAPQHRNQRERQRLCIRTDSIFLLRTKPP